MSGSVGSLLIGVKAQIEQLNQDLQRAKGSVRKFADDAKSAGDRARGAMERLGMSGETLKRSFGNVATGVLLMTDSFSEAGKAGRVLEQTLGGFLAGGPIGAGVALVTGAFKLFADATRDSGKEAEEAQKKYDAWLKDVEESSKKAAEGLRELMRATGAKEFEFVGINFSREKKRISDEIRRLIDPDNGELLKQQAALAKMPTREELQRRMFRGAVGGQLSEEEATKLLQRRIDQEKVVNSLRSELLRLEGQLGELRKQEALDAERAAQAAREAAEADREGAAAKADKARKAAEVAQWEEQIGELAAAIAEDSKRIDDEWESWVDSVIAGNRELERIDSSVASILRKYEQQKALAEATTEAERDRLEVAAEAWRVLEMGGSLEQYSAVFDAGMAAKKAERDAKLRDAIVPSAGVAEDTGRQVGREMAHGVSAGLAEARIQEIDPVFRSIVDTLSSGLTSALVDGARTGFQNLQQIAMRVVDQLLEQIIASIIQSQLQSLFAGILGGVAGGGGGGGVGGFISTAIGIGSSLGGGGGGGFAPISAAPTISPSLPIGDCAT